MAVFIGLVKVRLFWLVVNCLVFFWVWRVRDGLGFSRLVIRGGIS